jgi:methylenetetrahydrofolate reductase (NADPH)
MSTMAPASTQPGISFEFFPPAEPTMAASFWSTVNRLKLTQPRFVSLTYGAAGSTQDRTKQCVAEILARTQLRATPHVTCVGSTRAQLRQLVESYWQLGVRHIVALRGDGLNGERFRPYPEGFESAAELVAMIREVAPFEVSVAAYPETHPEATSMESDLAHLRRKLDAGACRALTQFFFDPDVFLRFRDACASAGIWRPVVPGILPILQFTQTARFAKRCGATIPLSIAKRFDGLEHDPQTHQLVSASVVISLVDRLQREGVNEFHLYTLNRAELAAAVCHALGVGGAALRNNAA